MEIRRGVLRAYDSVSGRATVQIAGSALTYLEGLRVAANIAPAELTTGRQVAVLFFDATNPDDAVIIAVWDQ